MRPIDVQMAEANLLHSVRHCRFLLLSVHTITAVSTHNACASAMSSLSDHHRKTIYRTILLLFSEKKTSKKKSVSIAQHCCCLCCCCCCRCYYCTLEPEIMVVHNEKRVVFCTQFGWQQNGQHNAIQHSFLFMTFAFNISLRLFTWIKFSLVRIVL